MNDDILKIHFGDIDGMYDPKLNDYFLDLNYWNRIVESYKFFVTGRKGTGKSALYNWIGLQAEQRGYLCKNSLFNEFPFRKLLSLSDDDFLRPYQYQTICKYMILSQFVYIICLDEERIVDNECYKELRYFNDKINEKGLEDCFRNTLDCIEKTGGSFIFKGLNLMKEKDTHTSFDFNSFDIHKINEQLEKYIILYFKMYPKNKKFIIQIDGIDENYNQISAMESAVDNYFCLIISLMKVVYTINQKLHHQCNDIGKCIIYLRSDIFFKIHKLDAESARWEQQLEELNWGIRLRSDWKNNNLRRLINARISASIPNYKALDAFDKVFDYRSIHLYSGNPNNRRIVDDMFKYIVTRTFHRPRDVIQFCISIQTQVRETRSFTWKSVKTAEQQYSLWLLDEISNEISPEIKHIDELLRLLRNVGPRPLAISRFRELYNKYEHTIGLDSMHLLDFLYNISVIYNINDNGDVFSSIRNERSKVNPDLKIALHPGIWKGLYTSTFNT